MGDSMAVEFAQQAHFNVLRFEASCMNPSQQVTYRTPVPRSSTWEFLSIDDHLTQLISRSAWRASQPLRDSEIFESAEGAYKRVRLVQHPRKRRREETRGVYLGAEVDGVLGLVGAPRARVLVLMLLTTIIARKGVCSASLLASLVGLWIHVLMFRRPVMALLSQSFADARREPADEIFPLHRNTVNELLALSALGPLIQTDLRVSYVDKLFAMDASPDGAGLVEADLPSSVVKELWRFSEQRGFYTRDKLFAMDASPDGAGLVEADLPSSVVKELWRFSEQRGFYTRLASPAAACLSELEFEPEPAFGHRADGEPPRYFPVGRPLSEGVLYDALELFSDDRVWSAAHAAAGLRVHPGFGSEGSARLRPLRFDELLSDGVFHELRSLALRRVVGEWHLAPPGLSFVALSRPRVRSKARPSGLGLTSGTTGEHNRLARRTAFLLCLIALHGGLYSIEQPGSSVMFFLPCFVRLASLGAVLTRLCCCSFGAPFRRPLQFLHNKGWLLELGGPCLCSKGQAHFRVEGTFSSASIAEFNSRCTPSCIGVYGRHPEVGESVSSFARRCPALLAKRLAAGSVWARDGRARRFHDDPEWVGELADCLPFRECYKTWLKWCSTRHPNSRLLGLIDSRVLLGASAKGRSSSGSLSRVLQGSVPYLLGGGLYPGGLHVYSSKNRSDGPSRGRAVAPPTKAFPRWLCDLMSGDYRRFDIAVAAAGFPKLAGRWLRLLLLLGGDIERNPGPTKPLVPRGALDLEPGFVASTKHKMRKALNAFIAWLESDLHLDYDQVMSSSRAAALSLRAFGLHLYSQGFPRYLLVYAITAVQDAFPEFRNSLAPAWQVDKKWQAAESGQCRPVISQPIIQAAIALALCWGWADWAAVTLIGFLCMLHPSEIIPLIRQDLVLPSDAMSNDCVAYVHVRNPKTQRFARRQHSRLDDPLTLRFLSALYRDLPLDARLFRASMHVYRKQWNAIMGRLGVPFTQAARGATPGVLRGSGATFLYLETEDISLVAWRGRWSKVKTMEFYLQEVAAQLLLMQLTPAARKRISVLRRFARPLLLLYIENNLKWTVASPSRVEGPMESSFVERGLCISAFV
eukprot:s5802_g2.t1